MAGRRVTRDRAAQSDFDVVRVWAEHEDVDRHPVTLPCYVCLLTTGERGAS